MTLGNRYTWYAISHVYCMYHVLLLLLVLPLFSHTRYYSSPGSCPCVITGQDQITLECVKFRGSMDLGIDYCYAAIALPALLWSLTQGAWKVIILVLSVACLLVGCLLNEGARHSSAKQGRRQRLPGMMRGTLATNLNAATGERRYHNKWKNITGIPGLRYVYSCAPYYIPDTRFPFGMQVTCKPGGVVRRKGSRS